MAKRKTIGKNPLSQGMAEIGAISSPGAAVPAVAIPDFREIVPMLDRVPPRAWRQLGKKAAEAVGGRLEILGGDLGIGSCTIGRIRGKRIGFIAPVGGTIDLEADLDTVCSWPDRGEHRALAAVGWAWALGSIAGIFGLAAGVGIRLLHPKRMIAEMVLSDGRKLIVRTDSVTTTALADLADRRGEIKA